MSKVIELLALRSKETNLAKRYEEKQKQMQALELEMSAVSSALFETTRTLKYEVEASSFIYPDYLKELDLANAKFKSFWIDGSSYAERRYLCEKAGVDVSFALNLYHNLSPFEIGSLSYAYRMENK